MLSLRIALFAIVSLLAVMTVGVWAIARKFGCW